MKYISLQIYQAKLCHNLLFIIPMILYPWLAFKTLVNVNIYELIEKSSNYHRLTRFITRYGCACRKRTRARTDIPIKFILQCIKSSQLPTAGNHRVQRTVQRRFYGNRCEYIMITSGPCVILSTLRSLFYHFIASFIGPRRIQSVTFAWRLKSSRFIGHFYESTFITFFRHICFLHTYFLRYSN